MFSLSFSTELNDFIFSDYHQHLYIITKNKTPMKNSKSNFAFKHFLVNIYILYKNKKLNNFAFLETGLV